MESKPYNNEGPEVDNGSQEQVVDEKRGVHAVDTEDIMHLAEKLGDKDTGLAPVEDVEFVKEHIERLSIEDCKEIIAKLLEDHKYDYNFAEAQRVKLAKLVEGPLEDQPIDEWELELKTETAVNKYYSPYPEVRAVTNPTDDPDIPCETIRAHLLGYIWAGLAQFVNSLFNSRFPSITLTSAVAQILLYPCGLVLAWVLPDVGFTYKGTRVSLNPGPWTYKEQMLATIIIDAGLTSAYCFWNIQTQVVYYHDTWLTPGYEILLLLSSQLMGLGFAGLIRRYVIYPVEALWPSVLPTVALNRALLVPEEKGVSIHGWTISRYKLFFIVFGSMFFYFWLPNYLFQALSYFTWMCWIAPNNFNLNVITGSLGGLGFNPLSTFDWNVMSSLSYPLATPYFAFVQQFLGAAIGGFVIIGLWWTNVSGSAYLPINSSGIFDNTGASYNISKVIYPGTAILDQDAYEAYSPAFYSAGNLLLYGGFFAYYPLTFVFILLDMWRPLARSFKAAGVSAYKLIKNMVVSIKNSISCAVKGEFRAAGSHLYHMMDTGGSIYDEFDDPLTNLMRAYPEVPDWWFLIIALIAFIFAIIILTTWTQLDTPVWTIFFVIGLNLVFLIPMTYLYAIAGTTEGLNVVTELVVGYALPGHPEALMFVKAFGYNINGQADTYISDQKMGFYAKVPPRAMYRGQVTSTVISAFIAYAVVNFVDNTIDGICTPGQAQSFNCENGSQVYFSSSVVWGAIGPQRIFGQIYPIMTYCFLLGFLLALVWWTAKRFGGQAHSALQSVMPAAIFKPLDFAIFTPISWLKHVHPSMVFNGLLAWAPYNLTYWVCAFYVSTYFMWYLRRNKTSWWEKYNYVISAGLDAGVAFSGIIIFFAVQYNPVYVNWWGNIGAFETIDGGLGRQTLLDLPEKGYFGPDSWH